MKKSLITLAVLVCSGTALAQGFGDNNSEWANDGECDDPRFEGTGVASYLLDENIGHDATDCQNLLRQGKINWRTGELGECEVDDSLDVILEGLTCLFVERNVEEKGDVRETPFVDGQRHGTRIYRRADGDIAETPYVNGVIHGTFNYRQADGFSRTIPYVDGEIHGMRIEQWPSGRYIRTPYVNGEQHGTEVEREFRYHWEITETPYVNGVIHGMWIHRYEDGRSRTEVPYVNGVIHGTRVFRLRGSSGNPDVVDYDCYVNDEHIRDRACRPRDLR